MKKRLPLIVFLVVAAFLGVIWYLESKLPAPVEYILRRPDSLELVSLDPEKGVDRFRDPNDPNAWKKLGVLEAETPAEREHICDLFRASLTNQQPLRCFWPRHAIHATRGGKTLDLVICFECFRAQAYVNNKRLPQEIRVSQEGAKALNQLLSAASIPLAPTGDRKNGNSK